MTTRFSIPTIWIGYEDFNKLFEIWEQISKLPLTDLDIELDFESCKFLSHNGVSFLGGLVHFIESRGGKVTFAWHTLRPKIHMNLAPNGFLHHFSQGLEPWDGNSISYRRDCNHDKSEIMEYLLDKWLGKGWLYVSKQLRDAIAGQVSEIYGNAFEHSDSKIGVFSCGQYYPQRKCLELSVIDFGIGIPTKVRTLPTNSHFSSEDALMWALEFGNSTIMDVSRGLGLNLLKEFINFSQGTLRIFSNDSYVKIEDNKVIYKKQTINFSGTFINISLKCNEDYYCLASENLDASSIRF